jgi:glycosyltransferase involved in cell wall biosynthesis
MHVLIVNQYALPAGASGITRHGDLGRELVARGHSVTVIASRFNYLSRSSTAARGDEVIDGVHFRWLETGNYEGNDRRRIMSMVAFLGRSLLAGTRLELKPDVVIGSSPQLLAGLSALAIARRYRVPFVFEIRDPWPSALIDLGAIRDGGWGHRILEQIERLVYRQADRIITVMAHADRRVAEVGVDPAKCVHIPNAADLAALPGAMPTVLEDKLRNEEAEGRLVVVYAGAHGISNALQEVIETFALVRETKRELYEKLALFLIGDGPHKAELQRRSHQLGLDHLHFHDPLSKAATLAALGRADYVLVHFASASFKQYGMSANKLFDAMAAGRPVLLASPLLDTPVDTVHCGIRYEPGSLRALADALEQAVLQLPEERRRMGERGRAEAERMYNIKVTARQLEDLLAQLV